jgi:hypothetical protein
MGETMVLYVVLPLVGVFAIIWTVWMIAIQRRDDASQRQTDEYPRWTDPSRQLDAANAQMEQVVAQVAAQRQARAAQIAAATYLLSAGTPATAQILSAEGGRLVIAQGKQECRIGLNVQIPGGQPYNVLIQQLVDPIRMGALQPGATSEVRVDPANPNNVVIDFSKPILPAGWAAQTERIECQWCKEQNEPNRTNCKNCGAELDIRKRIRTPDGGRQYPPAAPIPPAPPPPPPQPRLNGY